MHDRGPCPKGMKTNGFLRPEDLSNHLSGMKLFGSSKYSSRRHDTWFCVTITVCSKLLPQIKRKSKLIG